MAKYLNLWPLTTSDQVGSLASAHEMVCGYQAWLVFLLQELWYPSQSKATYTCPSEPLGNIFDKLL